MRGPHQGGDSAMLTRDWAPDCSQLLDDNRPAACYQAPPDIGPRVPESSLCPVTDGREEE